MYDVANRASFEQLHQWLAEAADFGAGGIPMAVCANKVRNLNNPHEKKKIGIASNRTDHAGSTGESLGTSATHLGDIRPPSK